MSPMWEMTGVQLVNEVLSGRASVREVADEMLTRIDRTSSINSFVALDAQRVAAQARVLDDRWARGERLALHGLPMIVKDNIDTADFVTTCGTPSLRNHRPRHNALAVQSLLDRGALIVGKGNLDELAGGVTNNNAYFGAVRNPYDHRMIAGGSSGGTAAAIAAGQVPVGLATDTGGSARIPAALCGVCGFRPTTGRYPRDGVLVLTHTRDTVGTMARTVEDIMLLDRAITVTVGSENRPENAAGLAGVRMGIQRAPFFADLETFVGEVTEKALQTLRAGGACLVESDGFDDIVRLHESCSEGIVLAEIRDGLESWLRTHDLDLTAADVIREVASPSLRDRLAVLLETPDEARHAYRNLIEVVRPALQRAYATYFARDPIDVLVYPTTPATARPIGQETSILVNGRAVPTFATYSRNTNLGANAGLPSVSIPIGLSGEGLPIGLSFEGPSGSDLQVLRVARAAQELFGRLAPALDMMPAGSGRGAVW
jgi:indoleacetamide hydrolase